MNDSNLLNAHSRKRNFATLSNEALADEFLEVFQWNKALGDRYYKSQTPCSPELRRKFMYHLDRNREYIADLLKVIEARGPSFSPEIPRIYGAGDIELKILMSGPAARYCPELVQEELARIEARANPDEDNLISLFRGALAGET